LRVVVDFDACQTNGVCMGILPLVFDVRDDGFLYVLDEHPSEDLRSLVEQAVTSCPTRAISIVEE